MSFKSSRLLRTKSWLTRVQPRTLSATILTLSLPGSSVQVTSSAHLSWWVSEITLRSCKVWMWATFSREMCFLYLCLVTEGITSQEAHWERGQSLLRDARHFWVFCGSPWWTLIQFLILAFHSESLVSLGALALLWRAPNFHNAPDCGQTCPASWAYFLRMKTHCIFYFQTSQWASVFATPDCWVCWPCSFCLLSFCLQCFCSVCSREDKVGFSQEVKCGNSPSLLLGLKPFIQGLAERSIVPGNLPSSNPHPTTSQNDGSEDGMALPWVVFRIHSWDHQYLVGPEHGFKLSTYKNKLCFTVQVCSPLQLSALTCEMFRLEDLQGHFQFRCILIMTIGESLRNMY